MARRPGGSTMKENETHNLYGSVPRARNECIFRYGIPADRKGLALVLVEVHDGEVVDAEIKQLERAVSASDNDLVFVDFRPCEVI